MGLPPDDMIGILTQTNIQNRIREEPNKWHPIQRCSCVIAFKKNPYSKVGCSVLVFKVSTKFFFFFFLEGHFSLTSTHFVSREKTRIKAREVP